jgi:3-oxoacyl-[acyl-carrier protein] reductase
MNSHQDKERAIVGRLDNKVAFITGAGSGIGKAGAELFAQEGAKVVVVDVNRESAHSTVNGIIAAGGEAIALLVDVKNVAQVDEAVAQAISTYGKIDILWSNAGISRGAYSPIETFDIDLWHEMIDVNLNSFFYLVRSAIPHMKRRRAGVILSTVSIAGIVAHVPGRAPYTASKGALIALTRLLSLELAGYGIRVNAIAPGKVKTDIHKHHAPAAAEDPFGVHWENPAPLPLTDATRPAEPAEIAQTALFLADDRIGPMTGAVIVHDGGRTSR